MRFHRHFTFAKTLVKSVVFTPALFFLFTLIFTTAFTAPAAASTNRWLYVESRHFIVYFRPEHQEIAARLLAVAEAEHPKVTAWVGHVPEDKTHIILTDQSDMPNGLAIYLYRPLTILFPVFPGNYTAYFTGLGPRVDDPLRLLFIHEYTHLVHMDMNDGPSALVRRMFGKVPLISTPNAFQPPLALEGLAVLAETELTASGRGRDPFYEMYLRTAFLAGSEMRIDQAIGLYPHHYDPAGAPYLYGAAFLQYLYSTYGHDKLQEINYTFTRHPYLWSTSLSRVLGKDLDSLWEEWQSLTRRRYEEEAVAVTARGLTELHALAGRGEYALHPAHAPDGSAIAYFTGGEVIDSIRLHSKNGDIQLTPAKASVTGNLAWSPDGKQLYYSRLNEDRLDTVFGDIYCWDLAAGKEIRVTKGMRASAPSLSPDGNLLLYVSRSHPLTTRLIIRDLREQSEEEFRPDLPDEAVIISASFAPAGNKLAVTAWQPGGFTDIYLVDLNTGASQPLMLDRAVDQNESWSPDGRYVFYDSDLSGIYNIYAYDTFAEKHFQISNVLTGLFMPDPAPDSQSIICSQYTAEGYKLAYLPLQPAAWTEISRRFDQPKPAASDTAGAKIEEFPIPPLQVYSPLPTLAPTYMLPFPGHDGRRNAVGIYTSGQDVLGNIGYSAALSYHPRGGLSYEVGFSHLFGRGKQWQLNMLAERLFDDGGQEQQGLSLAYNWGNPSHQQQLAGAVLRARPSNSRHDFRGDANGSVDQIPQNAWTPLYMLAWQKASATGSGTMKQFGISSVTIAHLPEENARSVVCVADNTIYNRRHRLNIKGGVAAAGNSDMVKIGGVNSDLNVRGLKERPADKLAAGFSGQYELRFSIKRGVADLPFFVSEATAGFFTDLAWTGCIERQKSGVLAMNNQSLLGSVGMETGIRLYLAYNTPIDLRFGTAKPLTGEERTWHIYFRLAVPYI